MDETHYTAEALRNAYKERFGELPNCGREIMRAGNDDNRERLLRGITWFSRAEDAASDDEKVLFYYIALNALFGRLEDDKKRKDGEKPHEWSYFFVRNLIRHDQNKTLLAFVRKKEGVINDIIGNRYLSPEFWHSAHEPDTDWQSRQRKKQEKTNAGIRHLKAWRMAAKKASGAKAPWEVRKAALGVLLSAIGCVRVLRNQMMHGACCYADGYNRTQMRACAAFLPPLVGRMIRIMISGGEWGKVPSPPQGKPDEETPIAKPLPDAKP